MPTINTGIIHQPLKRWKKLYKSWRPKGFFQFEIILIVLVCSLWFIWIPMLWVYGHYKYVNSFSAGIVFIGQNLTSTGVRFWHIKTVPALKRLIQLCGCLYFSWIKNNLSIFSQFEIIIDVLISSLWFIWIPRLLVYSHNKYFLLSVRGIDCRHQILTSILWNAVKSPETLLNEYSVKTILYKSPCFILHCIILTGENIAGQGYWVAQNRHQILMPKVDPTTAMANIIRETEDLSLTYQTLVRSWSPIRLCCSLHFFVWHQCQVTWSHHSLNPWQNCSSVMDTNCKELTSTACDSEKLMSDWYQSDIRRISDGYQSDIRRISDGYQSDIRRISDGYQSDIRRISDGYQSDIRRISDGYQTDIRRISDGYQTDISDCYISESDVCRWSPLWQG